MKILSKNLKQGEVKLFIETSEDLWYLSQIIDEKDIISGKTLRKIKTTEEADATKRAVFMKITTEKIEYGADTLRISGKVIEGPEDVPRGSYHTFTIEQSTTITIIKEHWYAYQLDRLQEAAENKRASILICVFDREDAYFALLKKSKAEILSHLKGDVERKRMTSTTKSSFYAQIIKQLEEYDTRYKLDSILLASPAFWKEELAKELKNDALRKKIIQATCSSADESAIDEVLKRDEVRTALRSERTSREMILVDKLLSEIAKKGQAVYSINNTESAAAQGAIETLLVTDSLIQSMRKENTFQRLDSIMRSVDKQKGEILIVSKEHIGGKKLDGLGGIAALLRYKLSYD